MQHMKESDAIAGWFRGQIPKGWWKETRISFDREEILVTGSLEEPEMEDSDSQDLKAEARAARIEAFREDTRQQRITIARRGAARFGRKVSWGARCGDLEEAFTTLSSPAMTRLKLAERQVLDTLVDVGAARSRSDALAWCVRLVGTNQEEWLKDLRSALEQVHAVRGRGPTA